MQLDAGDRRNPRECGIRSTPAEHPRWDARICGSLMERFRHDVRLAVAAYNAGEEAGRAVSRCAPVPGDAEYVTQVMRFYQASGAEISSEPSASPRGEQRAGRRAPASSSPAGTVLYTNIAYGGPGALALGR